jgi:hypothetical protein
MESEDLWPSVGIRWVDTIPHLRSDSNDLGLIFFPLGIMTSIVFFQSGFTPFAMCTWQLLYCRVSWAVVRLCGG